MTIELHHLHPGHDDELSRLKARIAELEKLNHDLCERVTENDEIRLHWEEIEQTRAENERMKARIAELEKENAELEERIADGDKDFEMADHQNERLLKIIRHQKYKRCLDNAWGCQQRMELFHELALEEARTIALPNEVALKENRRKRERAAKWHNRWLKIAEQFKEGV